MEIKELITEALQEQLKSDQKKRSCYRNGFEAGEFIRILKEMDSIEQFDFEALWPTSILCVAVNYPDGLGDFVNLLDISDLVKKVVPKTCIVQTLAVVTEDKAKQVEFLKKTHNRSDCELIVVPHSLQMNIRGELNDKAKAIIKKFFDNNISRFKNTNLIFNIASVSDSLIEQIKYFLFGVQEVSSVPYITLAELSKTKTNDKNFVAMGIDSNEVGIKLPSLLKNEKLDQSDVLITMSDQVLIKQIFGIAEDKQPIVNQLMCHAYLNKTKVRYGYLQNRHILLAYIMVNVFVEKNSSCEQLDFFLKPLFVEENFLPLHFFKENGIGKIIIFNLEEKKVITLSDEGKTLRLFFMAKNISESDIYVIKRLSKEMLGGSGDSSTLEALLGSELPFIGLLDWKYKLMVDLLHFIDKAFGQNSLFHYFLHLHYLFKFNLDKNSNYDYLKKFALSMGKLLLDNKMDIVDNMRKINEMLRTNYDVSNNLTYVIFYSLFRSNNYYLCLEEKFFHFIKIYENNLTDNGVVELKKLLVALSYGIYYLTITNDRTKFLSFFSDLRCGVFQENCDLKNQLALEIAKDCASVRVSDKVILLLEEWIIQFKQSEYMTTRLNF